MGNCCAQCYGIFRKETDRIKKGGGSKYFRSRGPGPHYTIEFENLVESDEERLQSCPRAISEEEMVHLKEHRYAAISEEQTAIDKQLHTELAAQEEKLRLEEEANFAAQREAARAARERWQQEQVQRLKIKTEGGDFGEQQAKLPARSVPEAQLRSVNVQPEELGGRCLHLETDAPAPERSRDLSRKTRPANFSSASLDLEWEDEEGMTAPVQELSLAEDFLWAGGEPAFPLEDSSTLEWENDFVGVRGEDACGDSDPEYEVFVNPVLDASSGGNHNTQDP